MARSIPDTDDMRKPLNRIPVVSILFAAVLSGLALVAFADAFNKDQEVEAGLGMLLVVAGIIELLHGFRRASSHARSFAWKSGAVSIFMGLLLFNASHLKETALALFMACFLLYEVIDYMRGARREGDPDERRKLQFAAVGYALLVAMMLVVHRRGIDAVLSIAIALRILGVALGILSARLGQWKNVSGDLLEDLKLSDNREIAELAASMEKEEEGRARVDRHWVLTLLALLFFIHLGRMGFDRTFILILAPLVALVGDMLFALIIAYAILAPLNGALRTATGNLEARLWKWVQKVPPEERKGLSPLGMVAFLLKDSLRTRIRMRKAGYSLRVAIRTGLKIGLPMAALLAAIMPLLGMSWYFDTENWASGIWNNWAGKRTDHWRSSMSLSTGVTPSPSAFRLTPEGMGDSSDFSFVVVGDPGEGDASQLVLKDQILKVCEQPEVRFLLLSSDIIYPAGAMRDYEHKFYMPFKGVTKPVYAIPGNHDWFDALEGFTANFYTPDAARRAMQARVDNDRRISSTTPEEIDGMIRKAAFLRREYGISNGWQQTPYFQVGNDRFVLLCIDTGVEKQVDSLQLDWVKQVLNHSRGKFVMALLGHPFYAGGEYQGSHNPGFEELHALLRSHKVPVVMAGDTHDMEYYLEPPKNKDGHSMHHFVNGGGGAYLSIGTSMAVSFDSSIEKYAFYPSKAPLVEKIEANTGLLEYPVWWYAEKFDGWPFSYEWLSGAFDYNVAPFFQSFMEVRVEPSAKRVRFIPYSQHGRLRWADMTSSPALRPAGTDLQEWVEWSMPMR